MILNSKFLSALFFCAIALSPSCNKMVRIDASQTQNFTDGETFTRLGDDNYSVVCSNNTTEIHTLEKN